MDGVFLGIILIVIASIFSFKMGGENTKDNIYRYCSEKNEITVKKVKFTCKAESFELSPGKFVDMKDVQNVQK